MKHLTNFINKFFAKDPVILLGRWSIVYCEKTINKKNRFIKSISLWNL